MRYYQTKSGYKYKEYKNGKKKRISNEEYKKNVNKLKGGTHQFQSNPDLSLVNVSLDADILSQVLVTNTDLIQSLVTLKKIINKINETLNKSVNTLNHAERRLRLAETIHNRLRTSSSPPVKNINTLEMVGQFSNPQFMELNRLFSDAVQSIYNINQILKIEKKFNFNSAYKNETKLKKIQVFYSKIIDDHFPKIQKNGFENSNIRQAVLMYCLNLREDLRTQVKELNYGVNKFGPIELWDVSKITNMSYLCSGIALDFNQDISGWDVSNVTNMSGMFYRAESFNADIGRWDVSNVTDMRSMFMNATSFNQDISGWDLSRLTNIMKMFENCPIREEFKCKPK